MLNVRIEKREWQSRLYGLHPQAHLAELDSHGIQVDAVDAATDHLSERVAVLGRRRCPVGLQTRDVRREPARSRK